MYCEVDLMPVDRSEESICAKSPAPFEVLTQMAAVGFLTPIFPPLPDLLVAIQIL